MKQFKPYFVGEERRPGPRAVSVQKCVRAGGKHNDLDDIGRTNRHFTLLRDARQLQLRRLLQGRGDPVGLGVPHRGARPRPRAALGDRPRRPTTRRPPSGATRSASRPSGSSASTRTTSGTWATPARAVRPRSCSGTSGDASAPTAGRPTGARTASSSCGTSSSCSSTSAPTARCRCRSRTSTPAPASSATSWSLQAVDSIFDIDVFAAARRPRRAGHRRDVRRKADRSTCRCASSPTTPAR